MIAVVMNGDKHNGARLLDGILGEFTTPDPLSEKYPSLSHYVHCADNPLSYIDPDGREIVAVYDGISYTYRKVGDEYAFYDRDGNSYSGNDPFMASLTSALKEIGKGRNGSSLLDYLATHENKVEIKQSNKGNRMKTTAPYNIAWNQHLDIGGYCELGSGYTIERPPFIGLAHEMAHIQDKWRGTMDNSYWLTVFGKDVNRSEIFASHVENLIRAEHGIPLRTHYSYSEINYVPVEASRIVWGWNISKYYYPRIYNFNGFLSNF